MASWRSVSENVIAPQVEATQWPTTTTKTESSCSSSCCHKPLALSPPGFGMQLADSNDWPSRNYQILVWRSNLFPSCSVFCCCSESTSAQKCVCAGTGQWKRKNQVAGQRQGWHGVSHFNSNDFLVQLKLPLEIRAAGWVSMPVNNWGVRLIQTHFYFCRFMLS